METRRILLYVLLVLHALILSQVNATDFLNQGDIAYKLRKDDLKAREAFEFYRQAVSHSPQNPEALWRLSMVCYFIGMRLTQNRDEKLEIFELGKEVGKRAL